MEDRSPQNKHIQTGLCLRQKQNCSRINKEEDRTTSQCQNSKQNDNFFTRTFKNRTDDFTSRSSCLNAKNTTNVASSVQQQLRFTNRSQNLSSQAQQHAKGSLIQKNKILLNKYKLIRRLSAAAPSATKLNTSPLNKNGNVSKATFSHNINERQHRDKNVSSNFYRKINNAKMKPTMN